MEPRASRAAVDQARLAAQQAGDPSTLAARLGRRTNRFVARALPRFRAFIEKGGQDFRTVRRSRAKDPIEVARIPKRLRPDELRVLYACRNRRKEARDGLYRIFEEYTRQLEGASMRCGFIDAADRGLGIPVAKNAASTGLARWTVERRLQDLHDAGWMESKQPRELKEGGRYIGFPAVRRLTRRPFELCGMARELEDWRAWCSRQRRKERERASRSGLERRERQRRHGRLGLAGADRRQAGETEGRAYTEALGQLMQENQGRDPPLSHDEMRAEARRRARPPPPHRT